MLNMAESSESGNSPVDKAAVDASPPGSITFSAEPPACVGPAAFAEAFQRLVERVQSQHTLALSPLRLVLLTPHLGDAAARWQHDLGLSIAGVSKQAEGVAVGKTMSWGSDEEFWRSIIILADYMGAGLVADNQIAVATVAHELGHVHDDFARAYLRGFQSSGPVPYAHDWPQLCVCIAEITWSEHEAETIGARYIPPEELRAYIENDVLHLAGVHKRLRELVQNYKLKQCDLGTLWQSAVTGISDVFANLGRATARLPLPEFLDRFSILPNEAPGWKPVIERFSTEIHTLGDGHYANWEANPFRGLAESVALGFEAVGLFPNYDKDHLFVTVP